jgi:hypothetical protein
VKAKHNASLVERIGRTHGSVEFKHQNISAVLPWIPGYKPKRNYQGAIIERLFHHGGSIVCIYSRTRRESLPWRLPSNP